MPTMQTTTERPFTGNPISSGFFFRHSLLIIPLLWLVLGCAEGDPRGEEIIREEPPTGIPEFTPPAFPEGRTLDTLFGINLDSDTTPEYVVTSLAAAERFPAGVRADLLEIYDLDEKSGSWRLALSDTLLWLDSIQVLDLTDDDIPEIVAMTFAGGNDEVAGRGVSIYSGGKPPIQQIFSRGGGMPRIVTLDSAHYLLLHTQYWPEFLPHAAAVPIPDELLTFRGGESRSDFESARKYFSLRGDKLQQQVEGLLSRYRRGGTGGESELLPPAEATELYSLVIETIQTLRMAGDKRALDNFTAGLVPRLTGLIDEEQMMMIEDEQY